MVELKVQISDSLAARLAPVRERLPELLEQIAQTLTPDTRLATLSLQMNQAASASPAYAEVLDFLVTSPSPQEILTFAVSAETQERLGDLLDQNREGELTELEQAELDAFEQIEHVVVLLKARGHHLLAKQQINN